MDFSLNSEQELLQKEIIRFAQKELNGDVIANDRAQHFPKENWDKCAEMGLMGLPVSSEFGGAELDGISTAAALEGLGYGSRDGGVNFSVCAHLLACVVPVWKFADSHLQEKYLKQLSTGKAIAVNATTEPEAGSDIFTMKTTAKPADGGFVLNGTKTFATNAPVADLALVYAATDSEKGFFGGITAFIVEKAEAGFRIGQRFEKMGLRTSPIGELIFEDVFVSSENVVGQTGQGGAIFNYSMQWERAGIAALHVGTMQRLLETAAGYAKNRRQGGQVIGKHQAVAHKIADMKIRYEAARLLGYKAAATLQSSRPDAMPISVAKTFVSEALVKTAADAMQIMGGNGYMADYEVERAMRDAMAGTIYSGTSEVQRNIIAGMMGV